MRHLFATAAALGLAAALGTAGGRSEKPDPSVTYAKTWEAAVEEAKLLNLPIVVHSHGFY